MERFGPCLLLLLACMSTHGSRPTRDQSVRLAGGKLSSEGRVEVFHAGQWGTVCDDGWGLAEAMVVCRHLGYQGAREAVNGGVYGQGSGPIWLDDLDCNGTESSLSSCRFKGWGVTDCSHNEDAGVICERDKSFNNTRRFPLDHSAGLSESLGQLFDSRRGCDLTIAVRSPGGVPGEDRVCAHSLVLSLYPESPFYSAALRSRNLSMEVSQDCRPYVTKFLRYLYTRQIDLSVASARCLHRLASDFGIERLKEGSGRLFAWMLPLDPSFHTQVSLYGYAVRTRDPTLQETCLRYLAWNCHGLMASPAWANLTRDALQALLSRSDLVVPDEAFVLRGLERWAQAQRERAGGDDIAALLEAIRFPMLSPEELYDLRFTSALYAAHGALLRDGALDGFQFNLLPFAKLKRHMEARRDQYRPRIYTAQPWSLYVNSTQTTWQNYRHQHYYQPGVRKNFQTPVLNSAVFRTESISWDTDIFLTKHDCQNRGLRCDLLPAAWLRSNSNLDRYRSSIHHGNKIVLSCEGDYVFHVQDFKDNLVQIAANVSASLAYPCYTDHFFYRFVVSPEYVL
ncbi:hypothetical protein AAFF_G00315130 [Aldrovandia affinis]|uniref:Galectin-3-binding protein n=1 Tax=Aldrovandia affinis TaxID=143900 RepID=A0AAD7R789_9TELE|nr:hypothetical protein AAFF_G00315130 [Aldrovandia affinis]